MSNAGGRRSRTLLLSLAAVLFLVSAKDRAVRLPRPAAPPQDVFSFSEPAKVVVRHLALDLTVYFETRMLAGRATLDIQNFTGTNKLILDTYGLDVHSVTRDGHTPASFAVGDTTATGAPLTIDIQPTTHSVTIDYTATQTRALVWLTDPKFVYSNNEPVGARTWIPIQDTPAVRVTYDATLRVPGGLLAVMSAENNPTTANDAGIYTFRMSSSVPPYLIAFAVGDLRFHAFDARSGFYARPDAADSAAATLKFIPEMMAIGEGLYGEYPFGRYDILLMPPGYNGGMENPRLNFIGQRGLTEPQPSSLIAHELSHSWAGDLATLGSWSDLWINEGLASYLELRLREPLVAREEIDNEWIARRDQFASYAANAPQRSTLLHVPVTGTDDPNRLFNLAAYVKGALFFHTIETIAGREEFDRFLRAYFARFAWRPVDDVRFLEFLRKTLLIDRPELEQQLQLEEWIYQPGLPGNVYAKAWREAA